MKTYNPSNERIKRQYFVYLKEAKRHSEATIDAVAKALNRFETYTRFREFKAFHSQQAVAFKKHLAEQKSASSREQLSKATLNSTLANLKRFFQWLAWQPGFKSYLSYSDAEYFNLSEKDTRVANARREKPIPTVEQIKDVIGRMPSSSDIERRNRALIAFTLLTGARDSAIASMKLKHVDPVAGSIFQDAREVRTKFSKTFTTFFFPVDDEFRQVVIDWVRYLKEEKCWGPDDPLFPSTNIGLDRNHSFTVEGLKREHWSTTTPIRKIFREAFAKAGLPYFNPHSFRNTLVHLALTVCHTTENLKAWSQNLGHEEVLMTLCSYGEISTRRQQEILENLKSPQRSSDSDVGKILKVVEHALRASKKDGIILN